MDATDALQMAFSTKALVILLGVIPIALIIAATNLGGKKGRPAFFLAFCMYLGCWMLQYGFLPVIAHLIAYALVGAIIITVGGLCLYPALSLLRQIFR